MIQCVFFPADVGAEDFRVLDHVFLDQADQLLAAQAQGGLAIGTRCADQGVDPHQSAGNQQRCFEFALDLADLGLRQGRQALFDDLLELGLGPLLDHVLRPGAGEQCVHNQRCHDTKDNGAGKGRHGKLDRLEFHGGSARERTSAQVYRQGDGRA
ncbi:hypothetical protein D3C76_1223110 [compost metagenome]